MSNAGSMSNVNQPLTPANLLIAVPAFQLWPMLHHETTANSTVEKRMLQFLCQLCVILA